jgi:hypothetical protein
MYDPKSKQCENCKELKRLTALLNKKEESLQRARKEAYTLRGQLIKLTDKVIY